MEYKHVYALITRRCNLTCPYCDVKDVSDDFDHDKFFNELRNIDGSITIFGGEPTLFRDRLKDMLNDENIREKIRSITTNLMIVDDEIIDILSQIGGVGTSWNPSRFRNGEYETWKNNLDIINGRIKVMVLITMTFDLLDMKPSDVADIISTWNRNTVATVMFENLVDESVDKEYFERVDDWLCEMYDMRDRLPTLISNMGDYQIKCMDCSNTYHLEPNGTLKPGCPHSQFRYVPDECYTCEYSDQCRPCILQKYCSVPKKLHEKLLAENV